MYPTQKKVWVKLSMSECYTNFYFWHHLRGLKASLRQFSNLTFAIESCLKKKHMIKSSDHHKSPYYPDARTPRKSNPTTNPLPLASYSQRRYQSSPQGSMGRFKPRSSWMAWTIFKRWSKVSKSSSARAASYRPTRAMCDFFGKKQVDVWLMQIQQQSLWSFAIHWRIWDKTWQVLKLF